MCYRKAIPVYRKNRELIKTFEISISYLKSGKTLLVFPENDESKKRDDLCMLNTGFIRLESWPGGCMKQPIKFLPSIP
ncbi:MAG: hypothetical protein V3V57_00865 [Spirochaetia bacterium]